jgi:hypothetical protein
MISKLAGCSGRLMAAEYQFHARRLLVKFTLPIDLFEPSSELAQSKIYLSSSKLVVCVKAKCRRSQPKGPEMEPASLNSNTPFETIGLIIRIFI